MTTALDQPAGPGDAATGEERSCDEEPPSRTLLVLERVDEDGDWAAVGPVDELIAAVGRVLAEAPELAAMLPASAVVALSSDDAVRRLNAIYRGKDAPTNVLSFPAAEPFGTIAGEPRALGDVVLALETVIAEAGADGIPPAHHFQHLLIHGLLHLMGYDHQTDAEAERMEALETMLLARLGIPDPYAETPA
ncbi:MAG: rRNA maturation RNase YbeY [Hyphomicrobiaceae bacterium]